MHVQAIHQFHAMIFDGLGTDLQDFGDLLGVLAFSDEQENFALSARQLFERVFLVGDPIQSKLVRESSEDSLAQSNLAVNHSLQGCLGLFGSRLGLFGSDFSLFRTCFRGFRPALGLLRTRFRLLSPGFGLLNPCLAAGYGRRLIIFFHVRFVMISRASLCVRPPDSLGVARVRLLYSV